MDIGRTVNTGNTLCFDGDHIQYYRNKLIFSLTAPAMETCAAFLYRPPSPLGLVPVAQQFSVPFPQLLGFDLTDPIRDKVQAQALDEVRYEGSAS